MVIGTITVKQSAASLTSHGSFFAPGLFFPSSRLTYAFQRPLRLMAAYQVNHECPQSMLQLTSFFFLFVLYIVWRGNDVHNFSSE